jgi:hypothetical protein
VRGGEFGTGDAGKEFFFYIFLHILVCFVLCLTFRREAEFFLRVLDKVSSLALRGMGISFASTSASPGMHAAALGKFFFLSFFSHNFQGSNEM